MSAAHPKIEAITLFVDDPQRSKAFYTAVFGGEPIFEDAHSVVLGFGQVVVNLLVRSQAPELVEPATVAASGAGPAVLLTVPVDSADAACRELEACGATVLNGPVDRPWGIRTVTFADPDGHAWELAQALGD
jgi:catechol 2,3-dioxygenase-like lactoylglutathione lyase family enzyme